PDGAQLAQRVRLVLAQLLGNGVDHVVALGARSDCCCLVVLFAHGAIVEHGHSCCQHPWQKWAFSGILGTAGKTSFPLTPNHHLTVRVYVFVVASCVSCSITHAVSLCSSL